MSDRSYHPHIFKSRQSSPSSSSSFLSSYSISIIIPISTICLTCPILIILGPIIPQVIAALLTALPVIDHRQPLVIAGHAPPERRHRRGSLGPAASRCAYHITSYFSSIRPA
ncbi:hypothetical protein AWENTII_004336 [Aspergillus wentii]